MHHSGSADCTRPLSPSLASLLPFTPSHFCSGSGRGLPTIPLSISSFRFSPKLRFVVFFHFVDSTISGRCCLTLVTNRSSLRSSLPYKSPTGGHIGMTSSPGTSLQSLRVEDSRRLLVEPLLVGILQIWRVRVKSLPVSSLLRLLRRSTWIIRTRYKGSFKT